MPESRGLENRKEDKDKEEYQMSEEEKKLYGFYTERFKIAKNQRTKNYEYFDDMTYEQDYLLNKRALNSYLRRKINDDEVRVNTPTTESRVQNVANEILNLNLQPEIIAFDDNDVELNQLGTEFQDIVRRTNEMENDEDKYISATFEMLSQRAVFVEEVWVDRRLRSQRIQRCEKRILSGLQVYLGDIFLPAYRFNEQPFILKYELMTMDEARGIWGDNEKFKKYVKSGNFSGGSDAPFGYRMNDLKSNEVEIIHYYSYFDDEYMPMINGVMMYDEAQKLPWRWEGYNITMVILKDVAPDFAYGKSLVSSAKTLQALDNETIRNLIRKMRQAIEPPVGVKSGRIYSRDIWNAGSVVQGVKKDDIEKLIDHDGVTQSELQMLQLIEGKVAEFIGQASPVGTTKRQTAIEVKEAQKQAIKMLGLSIFAAMRLKRNMTFLRIYNVLENMTKSKGKKMNQLDHKVQDTYRHFTINDANIDENQKGKKLIQLIGGDVSENQMSAVYRFEQEEARGGRLTRVKFINVKLLNSIKINWFVSVINKERDSSELARAQYQDKINQSMQIAQATGRQLNANKVIEGFEKVWNSKDLFQKQAPQQPQAGQPQGGQAGQSPINSQIKQSNGINTGNHNLKPSINSMQNSPANPQ